ncbi:diguanylate cyclase [Desulfofarcimen acetoxidans DSM 771]|uniref:Diguanylate cyclase n=1 Tax=Desulfofarcimen acetoxidans (strain ATCC 49208 / DSM 771 / KCTC 5769 / VKM B-1644 / 5575) TaxID=485916 RepID=C8W1J5_DESAS|nr:GGDEF domain-containing protein [Desulfofarcimen acetoxidans]ACV61640.1 diguanylate cyclase [Desulfofarcimen acetoxidans DSM 771]
MLFKEFIVKHISYILAFISLLSGVGICCIVKYEDNFIYLVFLFIFFQTIAGLVLGRIINNLYKQAYVDFLTGLYNKNYFNKKLTNELKKTQNSNSVLSLLIIDIDNFKGINDNYGHVMGDKVISALTNVLRQNLRGVDILSRWGGEEFTVILPETNTEGAAASAERLRNIIEDTNLFCGKVTVSIGVASTNGHIDKDILVAQADKALYKAKEKRNTVVSLGYTGGNLRLIEGLLAI